MLIMNINGAHLGHKAASKVMAMVDSISTKVLVGARLAMTKFFVCDMIKVKNIEQIYPLDILKLNDITMFKLIL